MFKVGDAVMWVAHPRIRNDIPNGSVGIIISRTNRRGFRKVKFWFDPDCWYVLPIMQLRGVDV